MVILFIIVVLGYALCKLDYMGDKFDQKLSSIVIDVTCPALILSSVMGTELPDRSLILPLLGVGFLTYVVLLVFGFWVPRFVSKDRDEQGIESGKTKCARFEKRNVQKSGKTKRSKNFAHTTL